jgi:phospholipid-binding lipoprotein MlaA
MQKKLLVAIISAIFITAQGSQTYAEEVYDPLEDVNRAITAFNTGVDTVFFRPLAKGYTYITPDFIEKGISNFFANLFYPTTIINQTLQGNLTLAGQDTARFILNTTLGIGGLFDVASAGSDDLKAHKEDFGQTLGAWGLGNGPYFVIPIWGPSTLRDGAGTIAGSYTNPILYINDDEWRHGLLGLSILNSRVDFFKKEELISGDEYLFVRDAYIQHRKFLINNGQAEENDPFLDGE